MVPGHWCELETTEPSSFSFPGHPHLNSSKGWAKGHMRTRRQEGKAMGVPQYGPHHCHHGQMELHHTSCRAKLGSSCGRSTYFLHSPSWSNPAWCLSEKGGMQGSFNLHEQRPCRQRPLPPGITGHSHQAGHLHCHETRWS